MMLSKASIAAHHVAWLVHERQELLKQNQELKAATQRYHTLNRPSVNTSGAGSSAPSTAPGTGEARSTEQVAYGILDRVLSNGTRQAM